MRGITSRKNPFHDLYCISFPLWQGPVGNMGLLGLPGEKVCWHRLFFIIMLYGHGIFIISHMSHGRRSWLGKGETYLWWGKLTIPPFQIIIITLKKKRTSNYIYSIVYCVCLYFTHYLLSWNFHRLIVWCCWFKESKPSHRSSFANIINVVHNSLKLGSEEIRWGGWTPQLSQQLCSFDVPAAVKFVFV